MYLPFGTYLSAIMENSYNSIVKYVLKINEIEYNTNEVIIFYRTVTCSFTVTMSVILIYNNINLYLTISRTTIIIINRVSVRKFMLVYCTLYYYVGIW